MNKKIIITGATGLIGTNLCKALYKRGDDITIFTRDKKKAGNDLPPVKLVEWDYKMPGRWKKELIEKDAVIHLAGANLAGRRWSKEYKKIITESRITSTKNLINEIKNLDKKPEVFLSASAVGYYGDRGDEILTEQNAPSNDFLAEVCKHWEREAAEAERLGIRWVSLRQAPVLSGNEGMIKEMKLPFKMFLGGPIGNGSQWLPWIHIDDLVNIYFYLLDNIDITGPVNASSPNPVRMTDFARTMGKVLKRPSYFKIPKFIIRLVKGELADSVTASQKVIPAKLLEAGFNFNFKDIEPALKDLLN